MRSAAPGQDYEAIVIGGGVNGLVCAIMLAQAKRRVVLVEARDRVGGMCQTVEIAPGYRVSSVSHLVGPMDADVMKTLRLNKMGLQFTAKQIGAVALSNQGQHIILGDDLRHTAQSLAPHSATDAKNWPAFETRLRRAAQHIQPWVHHPLPVAVDESAKGSFFGGRSSSRQTAALDSDLAMRLDKSLVELLDHDFNSPLLKGAVALDALLGNSLSPSMQGTAFLSVMKRAMEMPNSGGLAHPQGGAGGITSALSKAADSVGLKIKVNAMVKQFLFDNGRIAGVQLANGETLYAPTIVSSLDAKHTLLKMGGERDLPLGLKRRLYGYRNEGSVAKVNLALNGLPSFKGLDKKFLKDRLLICPSMEHLEKSFAAFEQGAFASELGMEIIIPTVHDASLAKPGHHVLSANVMYVPRTLSAGNWDAAKADLISLVGAQLRQYAPELPDQVVAADVFTPADLATLAGGAGNHWHGGDLSMDQLGVLRPVAGACRNSTPVPGLFLCGAGTHPCGGVTGTNGRIAAEVVLAHLAGTS
ncbi:MAG: NAD(P)/FAD-dependent oxidoreductase [Micropepsaceae bacterium]